MNNAPRDFSDHAPAPNWMELLEQAGVTAAESPRFELMGLQYGLADLLYRHARTVAKTEAKNPRDLAAGMYDDLMSSLERYGSQPQDFTAEEISFFTGPENIRKIRRLHIEYDSLEVVEVADEAVNRAVALLTEAEELGVRGATLDQYVLDVCSTLGAAAHAIDPEVQLDAQEQAGSNGN